MQIPLFPLHTVLAPGIALPLHVFEERYRIMVRRCLEIPSPFGVVLIREGSEVLRGGATQQLSIAAVGTFAEIREASRYADGRYDVLAVGTSRFMVREVSADAEPYLVADVDPYPDQPGAGGTAEALAARVTRRFVDYLRLLQPREGESADPIDVQMEVEVGVEPEGESDDDGDEAAGPGEEEPASRFVDADERPVPVDDPEATRDALCIPEDPTALSFLLTGIVQVELDRKQALLEASSAEERLRDIDALLDRELRLLDRRLAPYQLDRRGLAGSGN